MLVQDRCTCGGAPGIAARPRSGAVMPLMSRPVNLTVHRRRPVLVTVAVLIALLVGYAAVAVTRASAASPLLSQGKRPSSVVLHDQGDNAHVERGSTVTIGISGTYGTGNCQSAPPARRHR